MADETELTDDRTDDFDQEIARTRQNAKLMALLDERARQTRSVGIDELRRQLGAGD